MSKVPVLELRGVHAHYGPVHALKGVSLEVHPGEVVALLGANGAGKSTTLRTVMGLLRSSTGDIHLEGRSIVGLEPHRVVTRGIVMVPEGRHIFPNLTVRENLVMGGYSRRDREELEGSRRRVFDLFPILEQRQQQAASSLSGGEQQMLAISRALMASPRLLLLDEPSLGLAPLLVRSIFRVIKELAEQRVTILLVEQNVRQALRVADRAYVLEVGRLVHEWTREELMQEEASHGEFAGKRQPCSVRGRP